MGTIKKSVKQMVVNFLKEKGSSNLKSIINYVLSEREVHAAHVRGVLNDDIRKGSKFFTRDSRGVYSLSFGRTKETPTEEVTPTTTEEVTPAITLD